MYKITTKKATSNSINEYIVRHHNYSDEIAKYRLELEFIINDPQNVIRQNLYDDEGICDAVIVQAANELLEALDKPKKNDLNVEYMVYRGLPCQYNSNTDKYYFGFSLGLLKLVHIDPNEKPRKERNFRSDLTKAKHLIRRNCMNWITICIDENTIIEKLI